MIPLPPKAIARTLLSNALAFALRWRLTLFLLALASFALATKEARYIDASGSSCTAFAIANHEVDICHGLQDRDASPAWLQFQRSQEVTPR